jgi:hypothetical protein
MTGGLGIVVSDLRHFMRLVEVLLTFWDHDAGVTLLLIESFTHIKEWLSQWHLVIGTLLIVGCVN